MLQISEERIQRLDFSCFISNTQDVLWVTIKYFGKEIIQQILSAVIRSEVIVDISGWFKQGILSQGLFEVFCDL